MNDFPDRFLQEVAGHELQVIRDEGLHRHLRFKRPGTYCMHFDLITWPGYLCYTVDMGTYVFKRLEDMLQFFRGEPGPRLYRIDYRYWAEKCEAQDAHGDGITTYDPDKFRRAITDRRRRLLVRHGRDMDQDWRQSVWDDLEDLKGLADDEARAMTGAFDWWHYKGARRIHLDTDEFPRCQSYTHHFLWCCHALRWGIARYDEHCAATATQEASHE